MAALASLLGLPLAPVISPLLLSARLSKDELRAATAAFHRARGYQQTLDFARFRENVLQEAFAAMPPLLMKRIFVVWSYLQEETGQMSLKEFLVGVMIVTKGTRGEQLRFIFQLMDTSGSQELSKSDTLAFLAAVATSEGKIVAVEDEAEKTSTTNKKVLWTVDAFADLLHPKTTTALGSERLTPVKLLKVLASRKFSLLYLLDWIPVFATQFQVTEVVSLQRATMCTSPVNRDFKDLQQSSSSAVRRDMKLKGDQETPSIISPLDLSTTLLDTIRAECLSILDYLVNTGEEFATDIFQQRFSSTLPSQVLQTVNQVDQLFPASQTLSSSGASDVSGSVKETGRQRFKHLVLILLSAFAKSAEDVVRLLFSIFDEDSKGSLDVLQFAAFLRFASSMTHAESECMAFSMIGYLSGSLWPLPASLSGISSSSSSQHEHDGSVAPSVSFATFADFFKSAAYREMELLSFSELEILHLIFHLQLSSLLSSALHDERAANGALSAAIERNGLKQFTKQLRLAKSDPQRRASKQNWFCLMERCKWNAIIEIVCDGSADDIDDAGEIDDTHDSLANDIGVAASEKKIDIDLTAEANGKEKDELVLVPITLWIMLSFWQRSKLKRQAASRTTHSKNNWREWTTCVSFSSAPRTSDYQVTFHGFCVAVSLTCLALEGAEEMQSSRLQAIVSEKCSIQDLLDAVQLPNNDKQRRISVSKCQLMFAVAHYASERQTLSIPEEFRRMPLKVLMSTILPQDAQPESFRCFELRMSAVEFSSCGKREIEQQHTCDLSTRESSSTTPNSLRRSTRLNASTGLSSVHGLANLGNTCFMNSALQCLVVTPLLREYFLHQEYLYDMGTRYTSSGNESPKNSNSQVFGASSNNNSPKRGKKKSDTMLPSCCFLPLAFGQLVAEMNAFSSTGTISGVCDVISPERMRNAIAMLFPHLSDGSQQDAQEFLSSLLSSLGEELRRQPVPKPGSFSEENSNSNSSSATSILSPQSRAFLSRLPSFSRSYQDSSELEAMESDPQKQLRFQVSDSDGRPDATVANEWWISHLISEPSIFTALFCGQFKSVLTCQVCGTKSARFEPFSSLQLPIVDENGSNAMTSSLSRMVDMIVIVHFAQPSAHSGSQSLRLAVQVGEDWTVDQLLMKLQQDHAMYSLDSKRHYIACVVDGCRIQEYVDRDALLMMIPTTLDVFELENVEDDVETTESSQILLVREFHTGDELLVWTSDDRFVKGVVTSVRRSSPRSIATSDRLQISSHSLQPPSPASYDVMLNEGLSAGKTMRAVSRVKPISSSSANSNRIVFFRFVHRRQVMVPFYCKTPHRLALCGFPSVHRAHASSVTGKFLYRVAQERFLPQFATRTFKSNSASSHIINTLVIRRVRGDGKCCSRCHWTAQCAGCIVPRSGDVIENLQTDDTFSIDWNLEPFAGADDKVQCIGKDEIEWLLTQGMLSIEDHASYVSYRQTSSHSLERSLKILCNSETLEVKCSKCKSDYKDQIEPSGDNEEKRTLQSQNGPSLSLHTKELSLWSVPPILTIQLKRFELGAGSYSWEKVNHCVDFPIDNLDLVAFLGVEEESHNRTFPGHEPNIESVKRAAAFLHKELNFPLDTASRDCTGYSLYGIVNHMGGIGSGHYTAHIKHPESDDWWLADDAVGLPVNIQKLTPSSAAYLLFYVRHDLLPPSSVAAVEGTNANGSSAERKRLLTFFPRQKHAVKLSGAAIQSAWQNET